MCKREVYTGFPLVCIPVEVVDGVAPVVLNVPAETGETHANIQPWHLVTAAQIESQ